MIVTSNDRSCSPPQGTPLPCLPPEPTAPVVCAYPPYQTASLLYDLDAPARPVERRHAGRR